MAQQWLEEPQFFDDSNKKKLPVEGKRNILITSALPYVNNVPHLGNIIGSVLSGDVFSRYCRARGHQPLYVGGTDEYGTATEMKALTEKVTPQEICDKFYKLHKEIYDWFNIDFDYFGRTTTQNQTEIAQDIFKKIYNNGFTSTSSLEQLHCEKCDKFLADRYVFGTCPHCKFEDARGDQCDGCGKLLDATDLVNPKCHLCRETPKLKHSKHIFLDLDRLSKDVERHFVEVTSKNDSHWSPNAISIVKSWLKSGLEKRCITRDLKWGTPVPLDEFSSKVFYVWFDAPIGYLSVTKTLLGDDWTKWWKNPERVELYQFLGKDNVAFHAIIFPATQIATKEKFTKVNHLCATEYLNYEDKKFSKSRGIGVFGDTVSKIGIPADIWRFYLIYMRPESQDTAFSWNDFMLKVNSELVNNLGNFVSRGLIFIQKSFNSVQPEVQITETELKYFKEVNAELAAFMKEMDNVKLRDGLTKVLSVSALGNKFMQDNKPWVLTKGSEDDVKRAGTVLAIISNTIVLLSAMLYPFMPSISQEIRRQCNISKLIVLPTKFIQFIKPGHTFNQPSSIFARLDPADIEKWKSEFSSASEESNAKAEKTQKKMVKAEKTPKQSATANGVTAKKDSKKIENVTATVESVSPLQQLVLKMEALLKTGGSDSEILRKALSNQKEIDALTKQVHSKFEEAKSAFVTSEITKWDLKNQALKKEVDELKVKMGYVAIPRPEGSENNPKPVAAEVTKSASAPPKDQKSTKKEKVEKAKETAPKNQSSNAKSATEVDIGFLDFRVGRIVEVSRHPDAEALYLEKIDLGEEKPRTVVSGLVRFVPIEQMKDRLVVCLCNLKPAKLRGVESQAMVMCASTSEKVEIMEVDDSCKPGDLVKCDGFEYRPEPVLNPKKKIWETIAVDLKVSETGEAVYQGKVLTVNGTHPMRAPTLRNVPVK